MYWTNHLKWIFYHKFASFYYLISKLFLLQASSAASDEESGLTLALNHAKSVGLVKPNDRVVVFQKVGDSSVVKIIELPRLTEKTHSTQPSHFRA